MRCPGEHGRWAVPWGSHGPGKFAPPKPAGVGGQTPAPLVGAAPSCSPGLLPVHQPGLCYWLQVHTCDIPSPRHRQTDGPSNTSLQPAAPEAGVQTGKPFCCPSCKCPPIPLLIDQRPLPSEVLPAYPTAAMSRPSPPSALGAQLLVGREPECSGARRPDGPPEGCGWCVTAFLLEKYGLKNCVGLIRQPAGPGLAAICPSGLARWLLMAAASLRDVCLSGQGLLGLCSQPGLSQGLRNGDGADRQLLWEGRTLA